MLLGGCRVLLICLKGFSFSVWNVVGSCICHLISCGFTDTKKQFSDQASCSFTRAVSWCQKTETEWMIPCGKKVSGPSQAVRLTVLPPTHFFGYIYTIRVVESQEAWVELGRAAAILSQRLFVLNKMLSSFTLCTLHTGPMWPVLWFPSMSLYLKTNIFWKASAMETLS